MRFSGHLSGRVASELSGKSLRDILLDINYQGLRKDLDVAGLADHLAQRPECVAAWQGYSWDKRTSGGFYFEAERQLVGTISGGVEQFSTAHDACAVFILRELDFWAALDEAGNKD